jgi:nucleotide-binding universal stress UspA family protein
VELYQIGDAYFVHDGHHRVSVARQHGATVIQAYVTEVRSKVPLSADIQPEDLILKAEQVEFLEQTSLAELRPENEFGVSLEVTCAGRYEQMLEHIEVHRYYLGLEHRREVSYDEAAVSWFDNVYLPVVKTIRELGILRDFPGRTEADLYLWMSKRKAEVEEEVGWTVPTSSVAVDLAEKEYTRWNRLVSQVGKRVLNIVGPVTDDSANSYGMWRREWLAERSGEQLFGDVLVAINDRDLSWSALEQAAIVVQKENGMLIGLHAVSQEDQLEDAATQDLQDWFIWRAGELGVDRHFVTEVGQVGQVICDRARWADLVVVNLAHPPQDSMLSRLQSGFRNLINQCSRPILVVPGVMSQLSRPLLAYDGSPKAKEALFVATYLTGKWGLQLDVLTVESENIGHEHLEEAQTYLMAHGVEANYHILEGPVPESILAIVERQQKDLLIMGGYRGTALRNVVIGSAVDTVLRQIEKPILICR